MIRALTLLAGTAILSACMTPVEQSPQGVVQNANGGECDASPAQSFIGHKANVALGEKVLKATGARVLRWIPPNSAVTMDYRTDRVSVSYDETNVVTSIACG